MTEKEYLILLDADARKRHHHYAVAGRITRFSVQLEVKVNDRWMPVVRYDCHHDFAHKDCYNIEGVSRKVRLHLSYEEAMSIADDDINDNWEIYRERFLRGVFA
jgi:hypothetical protein